MFEEKNNSLFCKFHLNNFSNAIIFTNKIAGICEKHNHHPDIYIHDYKFVSISSCTHDAWSIITKKDTDLCKDIFSLYKNEFQND